jgi:hypothetical protein
MFIFLLITFISIGCTNGVSSKDEVNITSDQIKQAFATYNISLSEPQGLSPNNVFIRTLNGVKPEVYTINEDKLISFFVYPSSQEAEKGLSEIENSSASFVMHSKKQIANVLFFYIAEDALTNEHIKEIMQGLLVTK